LLKRAKPREPKGKQGRVGESRKRWGECQFLLPNALGYA